MAHDSDNNSNNSSNNDVIFNESSSQKQIEKTFLANVDDDADVSSSSSTLSDVEILSLELAEDFKKFLTIEEKKEFDEKYNKAISTRELLDKLMVKISDRKSKSYGYVITFLGLLLYLYNESKDEEKHEKPRVVYVDIGNKNKKNKKTKKVPFTAMRQPRVNFIHKVISNPVVLEEAPFLKDWQCFEEHGFEVVIQLLQIAANFESQLLATAQKKYTDYIFKTVTKYYFIELENCLYEILDTASYYIHMKNVGYVKHAELSKVRKNYREEVMIPYLNKFRAEDEKFLNYLQGECDREKENEKQIS